MPRILLLLPLLVALAAPRRADACGAFIARTETLRFNDALELAVVRDGNRTILSVRNRYRGPVEEFALLVPVPQVLAREDVQTLSPTVFDELARLTSPTLTILEEKDPCEPPPKGEGATGAGSPGGREVTVEASFQVGEYDVEVLSATDASALDAWLRDHQYQVPEAMAPFLRPYVEAGSKFFVAKVDPARVTFVDGRATLSPLRFAYDSDEVSLPLRLSTANSPGVQDVIVHAIARGTRLEAASRPNATIPTGVEMIDGGEGGFAGFYEALFAAQLAATPGAVVTEYAAHANRWSFRDVLPALGAGIAGDADALDALEAWVVTRLHLRVDRAGNHDDLVLRAAPPIAGDRFGEQTAAPAEKNDFRAQYVVRRYWQREAPCRDPLWGRWENARGFEAEHVSIGGAATVAPLATLVAVDVPSLGVESTFEPPARAAPPKQSSGGCGCSGGGAASPLIALVALALRRRRRQ